MPKMLEEALKKAAAKKGLKGKKADAYIYGSKVMQEYMKQKESKGKKK